MTRPAFAAVVLDVDSTVSGIEGIDWLAERRGPEVAARVAGLTDEAMRGVIPLESVYGARLDAIRPTRADVEALSHAYIERIAAGCVDAVSRLHGAGVRVALVSGGLREAILPLAAHLGLAGGDLNAVAVRFDAGGAYAGYDESSPLATSSGKRTVVESLRLPAPVLAVGDGATDVAMRDAVDTFAAFTGFATRPTVVARADLVIHSFAHLQSVVLDS